MTICNYGNFVCNIERKIRGSGVGERTVRAGKGINVLILNEIMDNIVRIIKSVEGIN